MAQLILWDIDLGRWQFEWQNLLARWQETMVDLARSWRAPGVWNSPKNLDDNDMIITWLILPFSKTQLLMILLWGYLVRWTLGFHDFQATLDWTHPGSWLSVAALHHPISRTRTSRCIRNWGLHCRSLEDPHKVFEAGPRIQDSFQVPIHLQKDVYVIKPVFFDSEKTWFTEHHTAKLCRRCKWCSS